MLMRLVNGIRALLVLTFIPVLTLTISLLGIIAISIFKRPPRVGHQLACFWGRAIARLSGVSVEVTGAEQLDRNRPFIFAANHQSQFDIFLLQGYLGLDFRWLAKKELFRIPIWGRSMRMTGYIPVDRSHGRAAMQSLEEAAARIAAGTSVIIFPEGTRSIDGRLQPFKSGTMLLAIKSKVPLVPVAIIGTHNILPKGKLLATPGKVTIKIGAPIDTGNYTSRDKNELAARLRSALVSMLDEATRP